MRRGEKATKGHTVSRCKVVTGKWEHNGEKRIIMEIVRTLHQSQYCDAAACHNENVSNYMVILTILQSVLPLKPAAVRSPSLGFHAPKDLRHCIA
jgi:hypothetical protein